MQTLVIRILAAALWLSCAAAFAQGAHGLAVRGAPALPQDFDHLPYADPAARKGGTATLGVLGTFDSLNPFNLKAGSTAQGLIGNVFQSMMMRSIDEPFTLYGLVARSVEVDGARTSATFHLDPRARFSDGTPLTSADIAFSFELLKTRGRPQHRNAFSQVKAIDTPDPTTVHFDLSGIDDREMPLTLALMPVLSKAATDVDRFGETSLAIPTGSGPYRIAEVKPGEKMVLARNPDYWGRDLPVGRGLYNFDMIEILYFRNETTLFEAFRAGLLDFREETNPARWTSGYDFPALRDGLMRKEQIPVGGPKGMEGFVFNTRNPLFADLRVREALGLMFDFEWFNANVLGGLYKRTGSFYADSELASTGRPASARERALLAPFPDAVRADILEGTWTPPRSDGSGRDRGTARAAFALLAAAGYKLESNRLARNGEALAFEIMVQNSSQERLALNYAESLRRIGAEVKVRLVDEVQYQRRRQKFEFEMMIGTWTSSASPGNEQRGRWGSQSADAESSFNLAGVKSTAVDALIPAMLAARTQEEFVDVVRAYDRVLLSGFYIVPLYHRPAQWIAFSSRLRHPAAQPRYGVAQSGGGAVFGATLEAWWRE